MLATHGFRDHREHVSLIFGKCSDAIRERVPDVSSDTLALHRFVTFALYFRLRCERVASACADMSKRRDIARGKQITKRFVQRSERFRAKRACQCFLTSASAYLAWNDTKLCIRSDSGIVERSAIASHEFRVCVVHVNLLPFVRAVARVDVQSSRASCYASISSMTASVRALNSRWSGYAMLSASFCMMCATRSSDVVSRKCASSDVPSA
jgi:hypothetical protein